MNRRVLISALLAGLLLPVAALWPAAAGAQSYPTKPIKLIVPFPAGGPADLFARVLGNGMTAELGQQIVIENRAGVGGLAGVDALAKSAPDGYTIGLNGAAALSAIPFMVSKMPFDWQKDLALLTLVVRVPEVLVVHPSVDVKHAARAGRLCPRQSEEDQFRLGRHRHHHASGGRAAQDRSQDRPRARALSRRGAGGERPARRPLRDDRARHAGAAAAHPRRQGQAARGDVGDAQRRAPRRADHRRGRLQDRAVRQLVRHLGAGRRAARHPRQAAQGDHQDVAVGRAEEAVRQPGCDPVPDDARRVRRVHQGRAGEVGAGRAATGAKLE